MTRATSSSRRSTRLRNVSLSSSCPFSRALIRQRRGHHQVRATATTSCCLIKSYVTKCVVSRVELDFGKLGRFTLALKLGLFRAGVDHEGVRGELAHDLLATDGVPNGGRLRQDLSRAMQPRLLHEASNWSMSEIRRQKWHVVSEGVACSVMIPEKFHVSLLTQPVIQAITFGKAQMLYQTRRFPDACQCTTTCPTVFAPHVV